MECIKHSMFLFMTNWKYQNLDVTIPPDEMYGFVYKITVIPNKTIPKELWNKIYIGKKCFNFSIKKKLSKKARIGTRKRIERVVKESDWSKYYGSSKELKQDVITYGKEFFHREILQFCYNKTDLSLSEVEWQIHYNVLRENSYNGWISCKIYKIHLNN